ncbi:1-phosphatidylinositol 4,5-bisphosphate phosphodiesterase epsilon-1-like [Stegodyphus dumicola]|uniref:1-phosphatidylinositol 4,5-bisphosphate phosphodiesterase epsilon-1-like n=1 Tax=Stegodyphus dumicola TaxID=202533 RepID=UPI0015A76BCB|nr:1-phosphatidylinositol 4,5-bisphosphate phosphodiesterase epsilon-1-like [Stegodyphus dumicola]
MGGGLCGWTDGEEAFLVCIYNVAPDQPYAILKAPITSTSQDIVQQALLKARRMEDPSKFGLVEELEYPPLAESASSSKKRLQRQRRFLQDHENVFLAQQRWKGRGWFEMRERDQGKSDKKIKKYSGLRRFGYSAKGGDNSNKNSRRQVHSEGEDESRETTGTKFKRFSLKKLKTWR